MKADHVVQKNMVPPGHLHVRLPGHHWVRFIDGDGRRGPPQVLQWQPAVQAWCRSNDIATGKEYFLSEKDWEYMCPCPEPAFENDEKMIKDPKFMHWVTEVRKALEDDKCLSDTEKQVLLELCKWHGFPL